MIQNAQIVADNVSPARYSAEEAKRGSKELVVRSHILSEVLRNAQRWQRGYESPPSKALAWGTLYDCLLLTPSQWPQRYAVVPADAPKKPTKAQLNAKKPSPESVAAINWWKCFQKDHPGEVVSHLLNGSVHAALERLREDTLITELLNCSQRAVMLLAEWHDPRFGLTIPIKALIDVVPPKDHIVFSNSLWDLKTTNNASPRQFTKDAQRFSYHLQAAFYLDLYNAATGEIRSDFGHIVQENYAPYEYRTPPPLLSQRFLNFGRLVYQRALGIYCQALSTGVWPGYDKRGQDWPKTDCEDWVLSLDQLFDPFSEPEEEEDQEPATETEETENEVIP